jgi:hypothetical protein
MLSLANSNFYGGQFHFGARMYDAQIDRSFNLDRKADSYIMHFPEISYITNNRATPNLSSFWDTSTITKNYSQLDSKYLYIETNTL